MDNTPGAQDQYRRDDLGRPIADDGYPLSGMAKIQEIVALSGLSRSTVYGMLDVELPTQYFGRCRRVPWPNVRRVFLDPK